MPLAVLPCPLPVHVCLLLCTCHRLTSHTNRGSWVSVVDFVSGAVVTQRKLLMLTLQRTLLPPARRPQCKNTVIFSVQSQEPTLTSFLCVSQCSLVCQVLLLLRSKCIFSESSLPMPKEPHFYLDCQGSLLIMFLLFYITKIIFKKKLKSHYYFAYIPLMPSCCVWNKARPPRHSISDFSASQMSLPLFLLLLSTFQNQSQSDFGSCLCLSALFLE